MVKHRGSRALAGVVLLLMAQGCLQFGEKPPAAPAQRAPPGTVAPPPGPEASTWTTATPVPTPRTEAAAAVLDGRIYVAGGFAPGASAVVEVYDARGDAWGLGNWSRAADLPQPLHHTALVAFDGALYVLGGYDLTNQPSTAAHRYDPASDRWTAIAPLPEARGAHIAGTDGRRIALAGGVGPDGQLSRSTALYHPGTDRWTHGAPFPTPRDHLAGAVVDGVLYAAGGRFQTLQSNQALMEAYDFAKGTWARLPAMPTARGGIGAAASGGQVFVAGGEQPQGTFAEVESYSAANQRWVAWPPMSEPRHGLGVVSVEGRIHVLAGGPKPGLTVSGAHEVLVPVWAGPSPGPSGEPQPSKGS